MRYITEWRVSYRFKSNYRRPQNDYLVDVAQVYKHSPNRYELHVENLAPNTARRSILRHVELASTDFKYWWVSDGR